MGADLKTEVKSDIICTKILTTDRVIIRLLVRILCKYYFHLLCIPTNRGKALRVTVNIFLLHQFTEFYGKRWQALPPSQASKAYPFCYTDAVPRNYYILLFIYWRICDQFRNCSKIRFRAVNNAFVTVQVYKFLAIFVNPLAPATKLWRKSSS